jgi:hypothetical protein
MPLIEQIGRGGSTTRILLNWVIHFNQPFNQRGVSMSDLVAID